MEQINAQPGTFNGFQKLFRDNHISIDIQEIHGRGNAGQFVKFLHFMLLYMALALQRTHIAQMTINRGRYCHLWADQMRTPTAPLPAFKITVGGRGTTLTRR